MQTQHLLLSVDAKVATVTIHRPDKGNSLSPEGLVEIEGLFTEVGGPAIAGGFDLTLMCDIRYASERAKFGQREIALSLTPIMDPLWRIIGLGRAKEVALTGRIYDAHEAERMGYVSKVFPEGQLLASVNAIATQMAAYDRTCLKETKQLGNMILDQDLDGAMRLQEWLFRSYIGSEDNHRRIDALQAELAARRKK
ncbi:MAG: enoyl-CoA hydratase/isomerase family protein [Desulfobacterales bacterium]|nr:enoyl-CoA hydratase/isomerase family protein [Desulfobacterales bacterium]